MNIAVKLGSIKELELLLHYHGHIKIFELPAKLIKEKSLIGKLMSYGYIFNVHGITMYSADMANLLIDKTQHYLQLCNELGCYNFILHGLVIKDSIYSSNNSALIDMTLRTLDTIKDYAVKFGISCFLENGCYSKSLSAQVYEIPSDPYCHLKLAQTLQMGIVLDLGHAALSARWYGQKLDDFLLPYIQASHLPDIIHLSDNFLENDEHLAIGEGRADLESFRQAIALWPESLLTVENFPDEIHKSLSWLVECLNNGYTKSDIDELCRCTGWKF
ncbi:MAG TPA: TIM barrel protein [Candidatus Brocadiia bacterium]|nr:TIM barrel protein [Candidatus Brocadiales bacterium]